MLQTKTLIKMKFSVSIPGPWTIVLLTAGMLILVAIMGIGNLLM